MAKTYDTYKDSGIAWIGEIPGEWETSRLKFLINFINGFAFDSNDFSLEKDIPVIRQSDISEKINWETTLKVEDDIKLEPYCLKFNDIIIGMSGSIGKLCIYTSPQKAYINQRVGIIRSKQNPFIYYLLQTKGFEEHNKLLSYGTAVLNISASNIGLFKIPFPPLSVQQSISSFLDTKCGEIDSLISIQEEMISELLAYKQSVITEAVTKGLDKKAKMKNSGVEWIGEIPEEWDVQKLRTLGWCQNGISKSGDYFGEDYEYPFVSYPDAYKNFEVPYPKGRANSTLEDRQRYSLVQGDVLFTRTSETIEEIGFASTCTETIPNAVFSGFLIRFRPTSHKIYYGYSKYFFRSVIHRAFFVKEMNLVTRASLSQDLLKNLPVVLPTIEEQQAIATYLDEKTSQIDSLIALKQSKIESLKEYKKSIIYEYVTGKKRV